MKIKPFFIIFALAVALTACSASKLATKGKYDKAFDKTVKTLKKKPTNAEAIEVLKLSFSSANERDLSQISQFQATNSGSNLGRIADLYLLLQNRYIKMRDVLPFLSHDVQATIIMVDYSTQLAEARTQAADFNFNKGVELMNLENKLKAREAVNYFKQAQKYDPSDTVISGWIEAATFLGTQHVLFLTNDVTYHGMPYDFMIKMANIPNTHYTNAPWIQYYTVSENEFPYDYVVELNFEVINVVPERYNSRTNSYTKVIEMWEYEYDEDGKVKKDEKGNDIKHKRTEHVECDVIITEQTKSVFINARLNYVYGKTNTVVNSFPISWEQPFYYEYVNIRGDRRALTNNVLAKLPQNVRPTPFPSELDMIVMAREGVAKMVAGILNENNALIRDSH